MFLISGTDYPSTHETPAVQECSVIDKNDEDDTEPGRKTFECINTTCLEGEKKVWSIDLRENLVVTRIKLKEHRMYFLNNTDLFCYDL